MRIKFLGSSHGVPSSERFCSSIMLEIGENIYIIDAGAPIADLLIRERVNIEKVRAVFTTHAHGDHVSGILQFSDLINWHYKKASVSFYLTEEKLIDGFINILKILEDDKFDNERVKFLVAEAGIVYKDDYVCVTYIPTKHMSNSNRPSYAIFVEAWGKKILFSGDLSSRILKEDFPQIAFEQDLDLIVCEMAHIKPENITPYLEKCRTKQFYFNHVYPFSKFDAIESMQGKYSYPVYIAHDKDEIIL